MPGTLWAARRNEVQLFRMTWLMMSMAVVVVTALLTGVLRRYAIRAGLIDRPNARSSHTIPTPRGGGLAIVVTSIPAMAVLFVLNMLSLPLFLALAVGALAVALVGFLDDRRPLPARVRLAVHLAAALWSLSWLQGLAPLRIGAEVLHLGWIGYVLGTLAVVWALNLFNFMDGIDGIAATEAVFITGAAAVLGAVTGESAMVPALCLVIAAACVGFLAWNWPPAKIFMGDVGSGFLGYVIAVLAIASAWDNAAFVWVWLILGGTFFVDATVTLTRRSLRGERVYEAHRSHAYQWLARRWRSHRAVTLLILAINVLWLFPAAWLAARHPRYGLWFLAGAYVPLVIAALAAGAGDRERPVDVHRSGEAG